MDAREAGGNPGTAPHFASLHAGYEESPPPLTPPRHSLHEWGEGNPAAGASPVEAILLERCAHSPHLDRPEATLDAVADFVARVMAHEQLATAQ